MDRTRTVVVALICALIALGSGLYLGAHPGSLPHWVRSAIGVSDDNAVRDQLISAIRDNYYKNVDRKALEQASLKGVVDALHDPFSHYLTPAEAKLFRQSLDPAFEGVGMSVREDKRGLRIAKVFKGSPAERAGIRIDDVITAVNGRSIDGLPSTVSTGRIKRPAGTSVTLGVLSPGQAKPRVLRVRRARIHVPIAAGRLIRHKGTPLAYVRLAAVDSGAHAAIPRQLRPLLKRGGPGILLGLRGQPGGPPAAARLSPALFIPQGQ